MVMHAPTSVRPPSHHNHSPHTHTYKHTHTHTPHKHICAHTNHAKLIILSPYERKAD